MLGCTRRAVDKVVQAFKAGGNLAVGQLRWGSGRLMKFHGLSQEEMDVAVSKYTMRRQVGLSMK